MTPLRISSRPPFHEATARVPVVDVVSERPQGMRQPRSLARRTIYIVLPALNEEASLPSLLHGLRETLDETTTSYRIIVVDDGSEDQTARIVETFKRDMPVRLIRHDANQGLGVALRDGLRAALEEASDRDIIVTMDADYTHTPGLILRMVRMINEGYDVVIASRYHPESRVCGVPLLRRTLSR